MRPFLRCEFNRSFAANSFFQVLVDRIVRGLNPRLPPLGFLGRDQGKVRMAD
jgi:hypothetical protein